jgi:hypothetical protein
LHLGTFLCTLLLTLLLKRHSLFGVQALPLNLPVIVDALVEITACNW